MSTTKIWKDGKWHVVGTTDGWQIRTKPSGLLRETTDPETGKPKIETSISLEESLARITNKLNEHSGNISWLAENGGSGGWGGSGGSGSTYSGTISVNGFEGDQGTIYVTSGTNINIQYYLKTPKDGVPFYVTVTYNNSVVVNGELQLSSSRQAKTITIPKLSDSAATHEVAIVGVDKDGMNTNTVVFEIIESSVKLSASIREPGVSVGDNNYFITYQIRNKVAGAPTKLTVRNLSNNNKTVVYGETEPIIFDNAAQIKTVNVPFFKDLFTTDPGGAPRTGTTYQIEAVARCSVQIGEGEPKVIESERVITQVTVTSPNTVVIQTSGIQTEVEQKIGETIVNPRTVVPIGGAIQFTFNPLIGSGLVYYAIHGRKSGSDIENLFVGTVFDSTGGADFKSNPSTGANNPQYVSINLPKAKSNILLGKWDLTLRCWSEGSNGATGGWTDQLLYVNVTEASTDLLSKGLHSEYTKIASWTRDNEFPAMTTDTIWSSQEQVYLDPVQNTGGPTTLESFEIVASGTNGSISGYMSGVVAGDETYPAANRLRLYGEAYAKIPKLTAGRLWGNYCGNSGTDKGFTVSVTFKSDYHPNPEKTIFCLGSFSNSVEGGFEYGLKIDLEQVIWKYYSGNQAGTISCKIQQETLTTIDFVYSPLSSSDTKSSEILIYVNGVISAAQEVIASHKDRGFKAWNSSDDCVFLGKDSLDGSNSYTDVDFFDLRFYTSALTEKQVVMNYLNTKIGIMRDLATQEINADLYNSWRKANFFPIDASSTNKENSLIWADSTQSFKPGSVDALKDAAIPVMYIDCTNSMSDRGKFTKKAYEATGQAVTNTWYTRCTATYSSKGRQVKLDNIAVRIQGTSTSGYRSKNLEFRIDEEAYELDKNRGEVVSSGNYCLFQPKDSWFPERQFTLKADVVDSAHSNNASLGKWINNFSSILFDPTPPMEAVIENPPYDLVDNFKSIIDSGSPAPASIRGFKETKREIPTVKHTLEGFPIYLIIRFANEDGSQASDTSLGIYSFNLGRGSHFNMGFKFLESFSRRSISMNQDTKIWGEKGEDPGAPALIKYYKIAPTLGGINSNNVASFEFTQSVNRTTENGEITTPEVFSQSGEKVLKYVGEFKYAAGRGSDELGFTAPESAWAALDRLFQVTKVMTTSSIPEFNYDDNTRSWVKTGNIIPGKPDSAWSNEVGYLGNRLNIKNAYSYFIVSILFGMVDSLGKNLTLRCWNLGQVDYEMWYPCFYDMDTSLGLDNAGGETTRSTAYIDSFKPRKSMTTGNIVGMEVVEGDTVGGQYAQAKSRLWDILKQPGFFYNWKNEGTSENYFETLWKLFRNTDDPKFGKIIDADNFINNYFSKNLDGVGELLYNLDFREKYLTKYLKEGNSSSQYANIKMLHGTRVNFVRDWLRKRILFLDGVFNYDHSNQVPYNTFTTFNAGGNPSGTTTVKVRSKSPIILQANVNQASNTPTKYFIEENKDYILQLPTFSGGISLQASINAASQLTKLEGLREMNFYKELSNFNFPGIDTFDLSGASTLSNETPINFLSAFVELERGKSYLKEVNLSGAKTLGGNETRNFPVQLIEYLTSGGTRNPYAKLKRINISNSDVTGLSLPVASLDTLNIVNSRITHIDLRDQPFLNGLNTSGCNFLSEISLNNCSKFTEFRQSGLPTLGIVTITSCSELRTLDLSRNTNLTEVSISGCPKLESINLSDCTRLSRLRLTGAPGIKTLNLRSCRSLVYVHAPGIPVIPKENEWPLTLTSLNVAETPFKTFVYGQSDWPKNPTVDSYQDPVSDEQLTVLDLTRFNPGLFLDARSNSGIEAIRTRNDKNSPFMVGGSGGSKVDGCTSLRRILGHIRLGGSSQFQGCTKFYLNPPKKNSYGHTDWDGITTGGSWFIPGADVTNISYANTGDSILGSTFINTSVTLYDAYWIMKKLRDMGSGYEFDGNRIRYLTNTFRGCKKLKAGWEDPIHRDFFKGATDVVNVSSIFSNTYVGGPLAGPKADGSRGIFSPLTNVVSLDSMFFEAGGDKIVYDSTLFSGPSNFAAKSISWIFSTGGKEATVPNVNALLDATKTSAGRLENLNHDSVTGRWTVKDSKKGYISVKKFFERLPNLTNLSWFMQGSDCWLDFGNEASGCSAFWGMPGLTTFSRFAVGVTGKGSLKGIFLPPGNTGFPSKVTGIHQSFTFVDSGKENLVKWPIRNDMFAKMGSLKRINADINASTSNNDNGLGASRSFSGPGLIKYYEKMSESDPDNFPYDVFQSNGLLEEVPGFFIGMKLTGENAPDYATVDNLDLPGRLFMQRDYKRLTNISYLFTDMIGLGTAEGNGITLTPYGFLRCPSLNNIKGFITNSSGNSPVKIGIPYGFLEVSGGTLVRVSPSGWTLDEARALGIDSVYEDTDYTKYRLHSDWENFVRSKGKTVLDYASPSGRSRIVETVKKTITSAAGLFRSNRKQGLDGYKITQSDMIRLGKLGDPSGEYLGKLKKTNGKLNLFEFKEGTGLELILYPWIIENEKYQPVRYQPNPLYKEYTGIQDSGPYDPNLDVDSSGSSYLPNQKTRFIKTPDSEYSPYKYIWNRWLKDGASYITTEHLTRLRSLLISLTNDQYILEDPVIVVDGIERNVFWDETYERTKPASITSGYNGFLTGHHNYFCPPDLFRSFVDSDKVDVKGMFEGGGMMQVDGDNAFLIQGWAGRIPEDLFQPIKQVSSLEKFFSGCRRLTPWSWPTSNSGTGLMYPPGLFKGLSGLKSLWCTFYKTIIHTRCAIPGGLLSDCISLENVAGTWMYVDWNDKTVPGITQLPESLFDKNTLISNAMGTFAATDLDGVLSGSWSLSSSITNTYFKDWGPSVISRNLLGSKQTRLENIAYIFYGQRNMKGEVPEFWVQGSFRALKKTDRALGGLLRENITNIPEGNATANLLLTL